MKYKATCLLTYLTNQLMNQKINQTIMEFIVCSTNSFLFSCYTKWIMLAPRQRFSTC